MKGCLGAQYEYSGEILYPIPSICKLEKAKIDTLLELYNNYGILDEGRKKGYIDPGFDAIATYLSKKEGIYNERRANQNP